MAKQLPAPDVCPLYESNTWEIPGRTIHKCCYQAYLPSPENQNDTMGCDGKKCFAYAKCERFAAWYWRRVTHIAADGIAEAHLRTVDRRQARKPLPAKLRFDVLNRDGFRCRYCGRTAEDGVTLHVDHVVPVCEGGTDDIGNLRTACDECNFGKGGQLLAEADYAD